MHATESNMGREFRSDEASHFMLSHTDEVPRSSRLGQRTPGDQDHMAWGALSTRPAAAPREAARDEHRVDGLDEAVRALDVRRPVRRLRRALRLEADDRVIEPRLARRAAVEELAAEHFWLPEIEPCVTLPSMTWYLRMSAVSGVPSFCSCFSNAESDGARACTRRPRACPSGPSSRSPRRACRSCRSP